MIVLIGSSVPCIIATKYGVLTRNIESIPRLFFLIINFKSYHFAISHGPGIINTAGYLSPIQLGLYVDMSFIFFQNSKPFFVNFPPTQKMQQPPIFPLTKRSTALHSSLFSTWFRILPFPHSINYTTLSTCMLLSFLLPFLSQRKYLAILWNSPTFYHSP